MFLQSRDGLDMPFVVFVIVTFVRKEMPVVEGDLFQINLNEFLTFVANSTVN